MELVKNFMQEEDGVTAIEYGLLAALIALAVITGATLAGTSLNTIFNRIGGVLSTAAAGFPAPAPAPAPGP